MTYTATTLITRCKAENVTEAIFVVDVTSYTTGGETLTTTLAKSFPNAVLGMTGYASLEGKSAILAWDKANTKLMAYNGTNGAQVTASTDLGTWTVSFLGW